MRRTVSARLRARTGTRLLALGMAVNALVSIRSASADPGDIFTVAAPAITAQQPTATPIHDGDSSVSTKTGAFTYSYPIPVPPGRHGMQPRLALNYSSQGPIYGGVAAGWSLSIPTISVDTTQGTLVTLGGIQQFESSMAGGQPLVASSDYLAGDTLQVYRAQNDSTFVRYEQVQPGAGYPWRAYAPNGHVYRFGETSHVTCSNVSYQYAPLTSEIDEFGNAVDYYYTPGATGECRIDHVTWGENSNANIGLLNELTFSYSLQYCSSVAVGSQSSYRSGSLLVTGASELDTITAIARPDGTPVHTRTISLSYAPEPGDFFPDTRACVNSAAPYRQLRQIQETAVGQNSPSVTLPPMEFSYGPAGPILPAEAAALLPWPAEPLRTPHSQYNLSWGYRYTSEKNPTLEATMIDVDGDGLVDRLISDPVLDDGGHITNCGAAWERNLGNMTFASPVHIPMPTLRWGGGTGSSGGAYASVEEPYESCSLNYQQTGYRNTAGAPFGDCPDDSGSDSCPAVGYCSNGDDCNQSSGDPDAQMILAFRWMDIDGDGLPDLIASPSGEGGLAVYNLQRGNSPYRPYDEPDLFGFSRGFPCPATPFSAYQSGAYTMCGGMYPWFVYKNMGGGVFGTTDTNGNPIPTTILYQPIPLETTATDSSINATPSGALQSFMDIDGDAYPDGVVATAPSNGEWIVYRNDGTGQLQPQFGSNPYIMSYGAGYLSLQDPTSCGLANVTSLSGLIDVNGDGLPDYWSYGAYPPCSVPSSVDASMNNGLLVNYPSNDVVALNSPPATNGSGFATETLGLNNSAYVTEGYRVDSSHMADLDGDGRVDIDLPALGGASHNNETVYNLGGQFGQAVSTDWNDGHQHNVILSSGTFPPYWNSDQFDLDESYGWEERSGLIDLDGDGILESVNFDGQSRDLTTGSLSMARLAAGSIPPPRLMTNIDTHRGATTSITYTPTTNASVVRQDPATNKAIPHPIWVVQSETVSDALSHTTETTSYSYTDPEYTKDPNRGSWAFRGFDQVLETTPSGSLIRETFSYAPDWTGELSQRVVQAHNSSNESDNGPITIDQTWWGELPDLGNTYWIVAYVPTAEDHYTCTPDPSLDESTQEANCVSSGTNDRRTIHQYSQLPNSNFSVLWAETETDTVGTTEASPSAEGDRQALSAFVLDYDVSVYRLRTTSVTKNYLRDGAWRKYAETDTGWDSNYLVPLTTSVWTDSSSADCAVSRRAYDMTTGNMLQRWKPVQNAANTTFTTYGYDDHAMYVTQETNELGQEKTYTHEPGTGTKLSTWGPNICSGCVPSPTTTETHSIKIDGIGRIIERDEGFNVDSSTWDVLPVELWTYADPDFDAVGSASSVFHQQALDGYYETNYVSRYTGDDTVQDGLGRPLQKVKYVYGSAPADEVTSYYYNNAGMLVAVTLPDPSRNDGSVVSYVYSYDSVNRPTSIERPDTSGVTMAYSGLVTTTAEVVGTAGGNPASTSTSRDQFDRLVEVDESTGSGGPATTTYSYAPDDTVASVTEPECITTLISDDFAGRRTGISRSSNCQRMAVREWTYQYDGNGNMVSESLPCTGTGCVANYTTTVVFDDLDRPTSKVVPQAGLGSSDPAYFGIGVETYTWDTPVDGIPENVGRLSGWASYGPGAATPTTSVAMTYDAQGNVNLKQRALNFAGYSNLSRGTLDMYDLAGHNYVNYYYDVVGSTYCQSGGLSQSEYDNRGYPYAIEYMSCLYDPSTHYNYVVNTRNVAGLVTRRFNEAGDQSLVDVESDWSYDQLGRTTSQSVESGSPSVAIAQQSVSYYGNDDPSILDQYLGSNHKTFTYGYDQRHQLVSALETTTPNYFSGTYEYGLAGRFTSATETTLSSPPSNSDVVPRDVTYEYAGADMEEVTALLNGDGSTFASYTYDDAGNQLTRTYPGTGESWVYVYDGKNQLRRVTKALNGAITGTEEYWYDERGNRTNTVKRDGAGNISEMIWWAGGVEAHYDASGNITHAYTYIALGKPVIRTDRGPDKDPVVEYEFYGMADGTLASVDQATGNVNTSFSYAPFGEVIEAVDSGGDEGLASHPRRWNDKYQDVLSSLTYYGARYYDNTSMTWTQGDPLYRFAPDAAWTSPRRGNLFSFSLNNSLRYLDPDGRNPWLIPALAGAGRALGSSVVTEPESGPAPLLVVAVAVAAVTVAAVHDVIVGDDSEPHAPPGGDGDWDQPPTSMQCTGECSGPDGDGIPEFPPLQEPIPPIQGGSGSPDPVPEPLPYEKTDKVKPLPWPPPPPNLPPARIIPKRKRSGAGSDQSASSGTDDQPKPADQNGDGVVTDDEEEAWMRSID
jgi:RHS repeat-associated protein